MEEQELFQGYEIRTWDFTPRFYKILSFSGLFVILAILGVAQSNLLTKKGCDSPLVSKVCSVIDTVVVGTNVLTTDTAYVNEDFQKTELENSDIVWVDVTGQEKFSYPEGYFALSNPELMTPQEITSDTTQPFPDIPGMPGVSPSIPSTTNPIGPNPTINPPPPSGMGGGGGLLSKRPRLPKPNNNPRVGKAPDSLIQFDDDDKQASTNPTATPTPENLGPKNNTVRNGRTVIEPKATPDANAASNGPTINKQPMQVFAKEVRESVAKKEIDLTQNFLVIAKGVLTKDGKLDVTPDKATKQPKSGVIQAQGDQKMIEMATKAIAAVGDSGWLTYLQAQGVEKFNFIVSQDNDNLQVQIRSDLPNPQRADTTAKGLQNVIDLALTLDKSGIKKLGDDEKMLLGSMKSVVNPEQNNQFILNFVMPKPAAQELITRKLKEEDEKDQQKKPNGGTASFTDRNRNTGE